MSVWRLFFGWPAGGVWSNLIAGAITAPASAAAGAALVWWKARAHLRQRDEQHAAELAAHRAAIRADVTQQLAAHHQALAEHITAATAPQRGDPL